METSLFIAQIFGVAYVIIGLGLFFNSQYYSKAYVEMMKNSALLMTVSLVALVVSIVIVLVHNVWEWQWYVIVTLLGWIGLVKAFLLVVFPKQMVGFSAAMLKNKIFVMLGGLFFTALGVVLCYFSFL